MELEPSAMGSRRHIGPITDIAERRCDLDQHDLGLRGELHTKCALHAGDAAHDGSLIELEHRSLPDRATAARSLPCREYDIWCDQETCIAAVVIRCAPDLAYAPQQCSSIERGSARGFRDGRRLVLKPLDPLQSSFL